MRYDRPIIIGGPGLLACLLTSGSWLAVAPKASNFAKQLAEQWGGWEGPLAGLVILIVLLAWGGGAFALNLRFAFLGFTKDRSIPD